MEKQNNGLFNTDGNGQRSINNDSESTRHTRTSSINDSMVGKSETSGLERSQKKSSRNIKELDSSFSNENKTTINEDKNDNVIRITPKNAIENFNEAKNGTIDNNIFSSLSSVGNQLAQDQVQYKDIANQANAFNLGKNQVQQANNVEKNNYNFTGNSNLSFSEQVDNWKNGKIKQNEHLVVFKETPKIYQDLGVKNNPITLVANKVDRIYNDNGKQSGEYHGLKDIIKQLPDALEHPLNIVESVTEPNSIVVVTPLSDNKNNIVIASLKINKGTGQIEIDNVMKNVPSNVMTSAYGKNNYDTWMKNNQDNNKIIYDIDDGIKKQRIEGQWLQLPNSNNSFVENNISENNQNVKSDISLNNMQQNQNKKLF